MIGFPRQRSDFQTPFYKNRRCESYFEEQVDYYLKPSHFLLEKKEDWKYFPFHKLLNKAYDFRIEKKSLDSPPALLSDSFVISIKNGRPEKSFQSDTVSVFLWKDYLEGQIKLPRLIENQILSVLSQKRNYFCSLNNTFYPQGFILILKKGFQQPLEIHYSQDGSQKEQALNLRNFIFVEDSAQVIECFHARPSKQTLFLNVQTDCFIDEKAKLEHVCLDQTSAQDTIIHQLFSKLKPKAQAYFFTLCLNAGLSRWLKDIHQSEESVLHLRALSLMSDLSHTDHKTRVRNQGRKAVSEQLYKSFLFDSAKHVFQGLISIEEPAEESDTSQMNKNYLFGPKASAVAFPELDVCPANVKAGHGAVVSPFSENEQLLFYLKSRGIESSMAFDLILLSLLQETLSGLTDNTQGLVKGLIQKRVSENGFKQ